MTSHLVSLSSSKKRKIVFSWLCFAPILTHTLIPIIIEEFFFALLFCLDLDEFCRDKRDREEVMNLKVH